MHSHVSGLPHTLIRSRVAARFFPRAGLLPIRLAFCGEGLGKRGERERDSIMNGLGGSVVDEKRTSIEGYPGKLSGSSDRTRAGSSPSTSRGNACMYYTLLLR